MESSSTLSHMLRNAELPCNQVSLGLPGYNQPHHPLGLSGYNQQHHHSPPSSVPTILSGFEPTYLWQEVHTAFRPEEKPGCMPPSSAFNFRPVGDDCGGAASIACYDITSHVFTNEKLSQMNPKPLSPYRQTQGGSSTARMMASVIRNGGVTDRPHLDTVRIINNKYDVGLTVDASKGGLAIKSGVHAPTRPMEPEFTNSACLTKQSSFSSSSELAQVAAYHPARGDEGSNSHRLAKLASQANLIEMLIGLDTPVCLPCNSPSGCHVSQTNLGRMSNGLDTLLHSPCNALDGGHVGHQGTIQQAVTMSPFVHGVSQIKEEHTSFGTYPSFSPVPINFDTGEGTQKVCVSSIHESDENFGLEASSNCEQNGGCGSTIQRVTKGKNKRIKDRPKGSTARVPKDLETDEVKRGKRCKSGECASEENQKVEQSTSTNSNDSTPTSGNESSKPPEPSKPDYIHVRARRGQATDSHSLAERVRREKISERMKVLQELVPGCIKVTGKALMLDEIINYVQSLQRQVEFLSIKLAALNPNLEFQMDDFSSGIQMIQPQVPPHETMMISAENTTPYSPFLHHQQHAHTPQQMGTLCPPVNVQSQGGLDMAMSTCVESMDAYGDAISQVTRAWDEELQHVGQLFSYQGRPTPFTLSSLQDEPCFNGQMKVEFGPCNINFVKNNKNSF